MKRHLLTAFVALTLFHCAGNWSLPLVERDEPRFAEATREMLERGDLVVPFFNGRERFDKPPLIYWAQAVACRLLGENEFAVRFPSAVFAALTALVLVVWGGRLGGTTVGWRAALIFSLTLQTVVHARAAVADMAMVFFVVLAAWAGWEWLAQSATRKGLGWGALFWVAMGAGFLAKGPVALLPVGMAAWTALRLARPARPAAWHWIAGALIMSGLVALWGVPALVRTDGQFAVVGLGRHVLSRSLIPMEGHGVAGVAGWLVTLPFYVVTVWPGFFPWSIWLPGAVRDLWQRRTGLEAIERFLVQGVLLTFCIFTVVRTKLPHYTLPAFPFMALLMARWWGSAPQRARVFRRTVCASAAVVVALTLVGFPLAAPWFVSEQLYVAAAPWLTPEMALGMVEYHEPGIVWAFRKKLDGFAEKVAPEKLAAWLLRPGPRVAVLPAARLDALPPERAGQWHVVQVRGVQIARGRFVELAAVIKAQ